MRYLALLLWLCTSPLSAAPREALRLPAGLVISSITIETHNVFETEIPADMASMVEEYRMKLIEGAAEESDELLEKFLKNRRSF